MDQLQGAEAQADEQTRIGLYQQLNRRLMAEYLPAVPISHSPPAIVVRESVTGLVPSPLTQEQFGPVSVAR